MRIRAQRVLAAGLLVAAALLFAVAVAAADDGPSMLQLQTLYASLSFTVAIVGIGAVLTWYILRINRRLRALLHDNQRARATLAESEARFRALADTAAAVIIARDGQIVLCNRTAIELSGYSEAELLGMRQFEFFHPDDRATALGYSHARQKGLPAPNRYEARVICKDGQTRWVEITAIATVYQGQPCSLGTLYDITERKRIEEALRRSEERHRLLADNANDVIWTMDLDGRFTYVSPSIEKLSGFSPETFLTMGLRDLLSAESAALAQEGLGRAIASVLSGQTVESFRVELELRCQSGGLIWTELTCAGMYDRDGRFIGILGVARDIRERKAAEARIAHMAQHDALTGLPNRSLLQDRIERALALAQRNQTRLAVVFLDLDKFKPVNDAWGHSVGDELLRAVAERIQRCVRGSDTVARLGGDEFVMLLPQIDDAAQAMAVAEKVRDSLNQPFVLSAGQASISATLGVAVYPDQGEDADALLRHADLAMYRAKDAGRNRVVLFDCSLATV